MTRLLSEPLTPPLSAPTAQVLAQAFGQPRCDLPRRCVGIWHRQRDRVFEEQARPEALPDRSQLFLIPAQPDKSAGFSIKGFMIGATIRFRFSWNASLRGCTLTCLMVS